MMSERTQCPYCDKFYQVKPEFFGRRTTCKQCNSTFAMYPVSPAANAELDDYAKVFSAMSAALEARLGATTGHVHTALPPLYLGGNADVLEFPNPPAGGVAYATCGLTFVGGTGASRQPTRNGYRYELLLRTRTPWPFAPGLLSQLGRYALETTLEAGHTLDFGSHQPPGQTMRGALVARPDVPCDPIRIFGRSSMVLLMIGITHQELDAILRQQKHDEVLRRLRERGVFPFTVLDRETVI